MISEFIIRTILVRILPAAALMLCGCMGPPLPGPRLPLTSERLMQCDAPPGTILQTVFTMGISEKTKAFYGRRSLATHHLTAWEFEEYRKDGLLVPPGTILRVDNILRDYDAFRAGYRTYVTILSGKYAGEKAHGDWIQGKNWNGDKDYLG